MANVYGMLIPCCGHKTKRVSFILAAVASPISVVPGTIHGRMETPSGIWPQHGIYGAGKDMDEVFGLIETAEKAAEVYTYVKRVSFILAAVASPISVVPGTIHGRMETPSGKTTKH
jgi:ribulose-5-phosphate 4-epimerase/fuculose-1-phosphate aldolase